MNLLFYNTAERVYRDAEDNLYVGGNFPDQMWKRYLNICDKLTVVMSDCSALLSAEEEKIKKYPLNTDGFELALLPHQYSSLKAFISPKRRRSTRKLQEKLLENADFVIIRVANSDIIKLCRKLNKPYLIEVVGCPWDAFWNHSLKGKLIAPYKFFVARRNVKNAPYSLYVTKKFLQKRYPSKNKTMDCSDVTLNDFDENVLAERLNKIKNHNGIFVLGTAAAVDVKYKGQQFVIKALAELKKQGFTNFRYDIAGGGDPTFLLETAREAGVAEQVNIIGAIPHEKIFDWLKTLDMYIQPSLQEGLPRSVIEAMSCAIPCMGTKIAGLPELINERMLFGRKDIKGIVKLLKTLTPEDLADLAKENFENSKQYDVALLSKKRAEFYEDFRRFAENYGK